MFWEIVGAILFVTIGIPLMIAIAIPVFGIIRGIIGEFK
jgi:hypothetical protein